MSVARYIIAGLGAAASVSGVPLNSATYNDGMYTPQPVPTSYNNGQYTPAPEVPTITQPAAPATPIDTAAASAAAAANAALAKEVASEVTNVNRFNDLLTVNGDGMELLPEDELQNRVVFDFGARAMPLGEGGRFVAANALTFPILNGQGIGGAVAFLNPCGMNSPHSHPRASEFLTVVQGRVKSGFMLENGFLANAGEGRQTTQISSELSAFQGTVFPQGSIHFQFNDNCEPATFVAALNSEDAGTSQIVQNFFFLDDQIVNVTLGEIQTVDGQNIDQFRGSLPANLVSAVDSCLARCSAAPPPAGEEVVDEVVDEVDDDDEAPATEDPASSQLCDETGIFCVTLSDDTTSVRTHFAEAGSFREERTPFGAVRSYNSVALVLGETITNQALRCQILDPAGQPITVQRGENIDTTFADGGNGPWGFLEPAQSEVSSIVCDPAFVADPQQ